ncbi:hypothetical protein BJF78_34215 [Pseudonocardia sp. CNS-139]|nr:hypothetical protein BJF78_34215 [Pseudonocardia sp. CNS-139]
MTGASPRAGRVFAAARDLVLEHGVRKVTIAEIAQAAGVGKGTVYLYWPTKEDLVLALFARDLLACVEDVVRALADDPSLVMPRRLAPLLVRTALGRPLSRRLHTGDVDALRLLAQHAADREVFDRADASALSYGVLPILRAHGLVRADRPVLHQAYTVHALLTGFIATEAGRVTGPLPVGNAEEILAETVHVLLEPGVDPPPDVVAAAATEAVASLNVAAAALAEIAGPG